MHVCVGGGLTETNYLRICLFSRIIKEKGIEDAVNAVLSINKSYGYDIFQLDIYGPIDPQYNLSFQRLMNRNSSCISYKGLIPFSESTDIIKKYFALIFPTYYEGEGMAGTLIDAMAAGVPVVASDWKYNSEIIIENYNGRLFPAKNVESLIDELDYIFRHQYEWNSLKANCLFKAREFSPDLVIKSLRLL